MIPGSNTRGLAVNWNLPHWENWDDPSLAGASEFLVQFAETRRAYGLTSSEGVLAMRRILNGSEPQVIVSTQDFQALIDEQKNASGGEMLNQLKPARSFGKRRASFI